MPVKIKGTRPLEHVENEKSLQDQLLTATNKQIDSYVDNNLDNLEDARRLMKQQFKILRALARKVV